MAVIVSRQTHFRNGESSSQRKECISLDQDQLVEKNNSILLTPVLDGVSPKFGFGALRSKYFEAMKS